MSDDLSGFSMMDLFRMEAEERLAVLSQGLVGLESDASSAAIEPLMRAAHSIKGAARVVGLDAAVRVAHSMEDVLVAAQKGKLALPAGSIDVLLRGVDFLTAVADVKDADLEAWQAEHAAEVDSLCTDLADVEAGKTPAAAVAAPPAPKAAPPPMKPPADDLSGFSMMDLFRMEAEERLAVLSQGLVGLESDSSSAAIEPLMRAAHSIKGAARVVGLDAAVRVAHSMEDVLVAAQKGKLALPAGSIDVLLRGVDFLAAVAGVTEPELEAWQSARADEVEALCETLAAIESGAATPASAPVPAAPVPAAAPAPVVLSSPEPAPVEEVAGPAPEPARPAKPAAAAASGEAADRVVRVTAESLSRLMGLAGESLVQTRRFRPFLDDLLTLKKRQTGLLEMLQGLEDRIAAGAGADGGRAVERALLARARDEASRCQEGLTGSLDAIEEFARNGEDISGRLHHEVLASRMRPLADGVRGFPRLVRDLARQVGKQARFEVVGEATGVDRDILDGLDAPLNHLIRNALDHGLEPPDDRRAAGKDPVGTIRLEARHMAGMLQIVLDDDGRGIDVERLRVKVVEKGLTTPPMAARMTEPELLDFLFLPGFSTKDAVTEISGRGVGLDVVQTMVQAVRGSVRVSSRPGRGTRFTLQLPLTMSIVRALLVEIAGEPFAFPLNRIDRITTVADDELIELEGKPHMRIDGQPVGLVEASRIFELESTPRPPGRMPVVVASDRSHRFGVVVDRFLGERDLRVAPLDARLGRVPNLNSSSVLENGWPVLIVDVEDLIRSIDNLLGGRRVGRLGVESLAAASAERRARRVLVVDDSITVRELERQLLENQGYQVDVAVDGVDGWNTVRTGRYDLVVSDVDMPRMDGIELVSLIKKDPRLRTIPVVIVSYKDREEDRIRGLDAGANFYLTKSSFHDQTFLSTVVDLIGEARE
ncbi:hybrid sensor histidine kinase/response regulator [Paludisphaera mucosa]|uniref:histidine kinase n=1 Tax=Paludisphaera mucosa TaxID=3030827 RepID=A0ABT6FBX7_9BACT|nr:hybrid sensor histidine kinase/response regulator [Paludisphaera mucosa]MDG3004885.1 hybrid sensor histidine kinase/response regulator [Paludisphaera mucosa]